MKSASAPMFIRCFRNQAKVPHMLIPDSKFDSFRRIVMPGKAEIQNHPIKKGDRVRIIDGELVGVVAYVQRIQGKKAIIGDEIRNICGVTIEIDKDFLEFCK